MPPKPKKKPKPKPVDEVEDAEFEEAERVESGERELEADAPGVRIDIEKSGPIVRRPASSPVLASASAPSPAAAPSSGATVPNPDASQKASAIHPGQEKWFIAIRALDIFHSLAGKLIKYGALLATTFVVYKIVGLLAGASPENAKAILHAVSAENIKELGPWVVALFSTGGFLNERRVKKKTVAQLRGHIDWLEDKHDPRRGRSGLTKHGTTPKNDE